ncbi:unnamed protein product, partial [Mesorhabditis belari]|uniref:Uncharacterized protein n=1 Tax=Mesorhabditis belari TaxID=2138241 RepID=A0AAF3J4P3_9BILA
MVWKRHSNQLRHRHCLENFETMLDEFDLPKPPLRRSLQPNPNRSQVLLDGEEPDEPPLISDVADEPKQADVTDPPSPPNCPQ